jgi:hypothetical protein
MHDRQGPRLERGQPRHVALGGGTLKGGVRPGSGLANSAGSEFSPMLKYASEEKSFKIHGIRMDWNAAQPIAKVVDSPRRY